MPSTRIESSYSPCIMWLDLTKAGFHAHNIKAHFHHHMIVVATHALANNSGRYWCWKLPRVILLRLLTEACQTLIHAVLGCSLNGSIFSGQADGQLEITTWLVDEICHGLDCFVWYVEQKMASVDAIWLFSVLLKDLPATLWLPTYRNACGSGYNSQKAV